MDDDKQVFLVWVTEMQTSINTSLPRTYFSDNPQNVKLLIFSNASLEAMCIAAYFRAEVNDGVEFSFVLGKSRIALINHLSTPRLEIQASVYSVRLSEPIRRNKKNHVEVGDLVWLMNNNVKRSHYKMARIQEIYPAKDGVVRSVLIKTHDGIFKRPLFKLAAVFNERFQSESGAGIVFASKIT